MEKKYNYKNCQSLFGYASKVHERSGGVCLLCGYGKGEKVDFNLWRQLTVEHLIGKSQGGYLKEIKVLLAERFGKKPSDPEIEKFAEEIDSLNTITSCQFCNSTTSRMKNDKNMHDLISQADLDIQSTIKNIKTELKKIHKKKKEEVAKKIEPIEEKFIEKIMPKLNDKRKSIG